MVGLLFLGLVFKLFFIREPLYNSTGSVVKARDPRGLSPSSHPREQPATVNELELLLADVEMKLSTGALVSPALISVSRHDQACSLCC